MIFYYYHFPTVQNANVRERTRIPLSKYTQGKKRRSTSKWNQMENEEWRLKIKDRNRTLCSCKKGVKH